MEFIRCDSCKEHLVPSKFSPYYIIKAEKPIPSIGHERKKHYTCKLCKRNLDTLRRYKITLETRMDMETKQQGKCLICKKQGKLVVDHCHSTQKVRGLLCNNCNVGLGAFKDNCEFLNEAITYLKK
jgi:hypothetical protein